MAPIDVMHALDLGLCRHFWMDTLTGGGLLKGSNLKQCQELLSVTTYPAGMTKMSLTLGDTGGGTPTAHGWSVLSRYLLPLLLALTWSQLTETEITFSSTKRTVTGNDKTKTKGKKGPKQRIPSASENDDTMTSEASGMEDDEPGPSRQRKRKRVVEKSKKTKTFSTSISLARLVEASLHLAHAARLAHAFILIEPQVAKLDTHLSDFVKILGSDLHQKWLTYNYHIVLHVADQIRLHGPPRAYWAYPSERLYGLMKQVCSSDFVIGNPNIHLFVYLPYHSSSLQVRTNRQRNGEVEFSLLSRTDDRHRVATVVNNLPPAPLALALKSIIEGQRNQGGKGMADEDPFSAIQPRSKKTITLSLDQLVAVCAIANSKRPSGYDPLIPLAASTSARPDNVASHTATRLDRITVRNTTLAAKSTSPSPTSDPSSCIIRIGSSRRAARFEFGFSHTFFEEYAGKMITYTYAQVRVLDDVPWPEHALFGNGMWNELGYIFASRSNVKTMIVSTDDIVCAALTVDTSSISWSEEGTVVAIPT
ncbi:hypothetical protein CF319_g8831 [Tilletia indica]|nr:hypothetical protein CF319_g8831 [Tilletia indica]